MKVQLVAQPPEPSDTQCAAVITTSARTPPTTTAEHAYSTPSSVKNTRPVAREMSPPAVHGAPRTEPVAALAGRAGTARAGTARAGTALPECVTTLRCVRTVEYGGEVTCGAVLAARTGLAVNGINNGIRRARIRRVTRVPVSTRGISEPLITVK